MAKKKSNYTNKNSKEDDRTLMSELAIQEWAKSRNIFDGGGDMANISGFENFINSDTFQGIKKGVSAFNLGTSTSKGQPNFLAMNQAKGSGLYGAIGSAVDTTGQLLSGIDYLLTKKRKPLAQTVGLISSDGIKLYAGGGKLGAGDYMNMGTTGLALIGNAVQQAQIEDTSDLKDSIKQFGNAKIGADNYDDLMDSWAYRNELQHISSRDLRNKSLFGDFANSLSASGQGFAAGSAAGPIGAAIGGIVGGVSSVVGSLIGRGKARREARRVNKQIDIANTRNLQAYEDKAQNIGTQSDLNILSNFAAYGGPLDIWGYGEGAIGYELAKENLNIKEMDALNKSRITSLPNSFSSPKINTFAKGGGIHIKPENRGKFTEYCGGKVTSECIAKGKRSSDPAVRKRATFAANARKWHHADGGPLDTRMELLRRLEEKRNRRGTYGGGKHGGGGAGSLFLESPDEYTLVKDTIWIPYRETFNDAFGRARAAGLDEFVFDNKAYTTELGDNPDNNRAGEERVIEWLLPVERTRQVKNKKAEGGELFTNGVTIIGNGGTHESNPYEGVQMGIDPQGIPNLVEEGEVVFNDYVFSNRLIVPNAVREKYKLRGNKELTFADAAKQVQKESKERPNDPISKRGLMSAMSRLQQEQEAVREEKQASQEGRQYAKGGKLGNLFAGPGEESQEMDKESNLTWLRYAPVVGSAIGLGQNLLSKPDYSNADAILAAAEKAGTYTPVGFDPIGNYLQYNPLDRNFYINKLNAQAGATRRAIMNTSSPSRNAALLAADYNAQGRLGDLARQAEEYNLAQRQAVEQFNRATNMTNAEMGLKAAMANQEAAMKAAQQRLSGTTQAMNMREEIAARRGAGISANLTNFFNSLGEIGREEYSRNMIMSNPALYYSIDSKGNITYKNGYEDLSEAEKKEVRTAASKAKSKKAKGGYLTIKKGGRHG